MRLSKSDLNVWLMIVFTLIIPILLGFVMNGYSGWKYISIPLHSTLESIGAIISFILSTIIFMLYHTKRELNHFHYAAFALISMGTFDLFHAVVYPGNLFVWLHSLAIFVGGIVFALVWIPNLKVSSKAYIFLPIGIGAVAVAVAVWSILNESELPLMIDSSDAFTHEAVLLNLIGGAMFILASLYFIRKYLQGGEFDDLLFAGHTMLFGSAGILFFFSSLWDAQWWFWHALRLLAYTVSLIFMLEIFYRNMRLIENANEVVSAKNDEISKSLKLLQEYKSAIYSGSIISTGDLEGNIIDVNDELLTITGYTKDELIGQPHSIFRDPATPKSHFKTMWETIQSGKIYKGLIRNRKKDGKYFYVKITVVPIMDDAGKIFEYLAFREDVTELIESQSELKKIFYTDALTALHNRFKMFEDIQNMDAAHIALINIDNFKSVNDVYGQEFGDQLLKKISTLLLEMTYPLGYRLYRNHGDEFALLAMRGVTFGAFEHNIAGWIKKIDNTTFSINEHDITINLSGGLVDNSPDVIKADMALKEAKNLKKSTVVYRDDLQVRNQFENNILWSRKLKDALADDRIDIVLQPIYSNVLHRVLKYEALIRYIGYEGEVVSPFEFLDAAKRTRMYPQLTRRVIKKVFQTLQQCEQKISINFTAEDIVDEETNRYLLNMIQNSPKADQIIIELVESEGIENYSIVKSFIDTIKGYGIRLAIDDFGTGYSNFEYLLKLNADIIKIDGSLIKNIDHDRNSYNVVETIVDFARKNRMEVVAEFVASETIQNRVRDLGIEFSQGYFIDKPKFWSEIE